MRPHFYKRFKLVKYMCGTACVYLILHYFGVFDHLFEKDFYTEFHYPYDGNIKTSVEQLRHNEKPDIPPINFYNYTFISNSEHKCKDSMMKFLYPRLVYIVKSATGNFDRRLAIRNSWGYENRFSDVIIRTVFLLGVQTDNEIQKKITIESLKYGDIVQAKFHDTYFNNTVKTMIGFKWAITYCPLSKFYIFADDDMYISTKNILRFLRNPTHYPDYLLEPIYALQRDNRIKRNIFNTSIFIETVSPSYQSLSENNTRIKQNMTVPNRLKRQVFDFELPDDVKLLSGFVFISSPHRHRTSKWYIGLDEYPYNMWPAYVTAGAFVLSREALFDLYYTSFYTKHFRFDDIYIGLVALKANIEPYHCEEFYFYKKDYTIFNYHFVVASHGYGDPNELLTVWNEQRSAGNA